MAESFSEKEIVNYPNGGKSTFYTSGQTAVIIDEGICRRDSEENIFPYTLITDKQNEYMHRYDKVLRFLAEDRDQIDHVIGDTKKCRLCPSGSKQRRQCRSIATGVPF